MFRFVRSSLRRKLALIVLATTFSALLLAGAALVLYDLRTYQRQWFNDLETQAEIIGRTSAPALAFDDVKAANENLALLKARPRIFGAAIYGPRGKLFASYEKPDAPQARLPGLPEADGQRIDGREVMLFKRIVDNNEIVGTVYLRADYELMERLKSYLGILGAVMIASLLLALLIFSWLESALTGPI